MATLQDLIDGVDALLGTLASAADLGSWGEPADYSLIVRQDQPPDSGSSQYKVEDLPVAQNTYVGRLEDGITTRTFAQVLSDIGGAASSHTHDGDTLQVDGINSDGGAFSFTTSGAVTFSQAVQIGLDKKVYFGDADVYIFSDDDGDLNVAADGTITVDGATQTIIGHGGNIELGDGDLHDMTPQTTLKVNAGTAAKCFNDIWSQQLYGLERSSDPTEPAEGQYVIWMSDGTGKGDDGDVMIASKAGGTTKYGTLFDHSGGAAW